MGKKIHIAVIIFLVLLQGAQFVKAQQSFSGHGPVSLRERQSQVRPGDLISNVTRVVNNTNRSAEFAIVINPPSGWSTVGSARRNFTLEAGDTIYFPIRIIASPVITSDRPQIATISLTRFGSPVASAEWVIMPQLRYEWSARLSKNRIILPKDADTTSFQIHIKNEGDLPEVLSLKLNLPAGVKRINFMGEFMEDPMQRIRLDPLKDTIIRVLLGFTEYDMPGHRFQPHRNDLRVRTQITSELRPDSRFWGSNVEIRKLEDRWVENTSSRLSLPFTAEFNAYDIMQENSYGAFSLYGSHIFDPETSLTYFFQSNFVTNYLNPQSFLGQFLRLNYQSRHLGVELGNITQNNEGATISGEGARISGKYENHRLDLAYMVNPDVFRSDKHIEAIGAEYNYFGREIRTGAWIQLRENFTQLTEEEIAGAHVSYRFLRNQFVRVAAGVSRETHNWNPDSVFDVTGLGYRINYNGAYDRLAYNFSFANNSSTFLARRGLRQLFSRMSWRFNPSNSIFATFSHYTSEPEYYFRGELRDMSLYRERQIYRLGYQFRGELSDILIQPMHERLEDPFLKNNNSGLEVEYRLRDYHDIRFFSSAFAGYTSLPEYEDIEPFFVARLRTSIRYFQYSLNFRYYFGPYYSNELRRFAASQRNSNRFSAGINFDQSLAQGKLLFRFSSLYNYTTYNNQNSVSIRPELFYFPQAMLRFGVYARYYGLSVDQDEITGIPDLDLSGASYSSNRFEFGLSIKKDFNLPVSGRRYYDYTVMVYRDISGTGTYKSGDPGVSGVWVRLQQLEPMSESQTIAQGQKVFEALTGKDGKATFINIPPGSYLLSIIPVTTAETRHETRTWEVMVNRDQTIHLSVDRGARVSGRIILERDMFTRAEYFPLGGIRITATNDAGDTFNTLTTEDGRYNLYLPKGRYTLSVNENVFGTDFNLMENNIPIEILFEHEVLNINFNARERGREIRIQRPENSNPE